MLERQADQPLYPKILWNRPISRATAGRLLLIGGHKTGLAKLQASYQIAGAAGIGALTILAPDSLRPMLGTIHDIQFAPSTPSGSIAKSALGQIQSAASYADATVLGLDSSNNSETIITLERFIEDYHQPLILVDDGLDLIAQAPDALSGRPKTMAILTMQQLFKLAGKLELPLTIRPDSGQTGKVDILAELWELLKIDLALIGPEIIIRVGDQTSITTLPKQPTNLLTASYGILSDFYTQNPSATYQGLTTGAFLVKQAIEVAAGESIADLASAITKVLSQFEN